MSTPRSISAREAAALLRPIDRLGIPLGPGQPIAFLRALGEREDWQRLEVFGALLVELFAVFGRPGVHLRSGFFGPAERALRAAGHDVAFVPADFRRFREIAERFAPRVVATAGAPPDAQGRVSLSLHAGATVSEIHAAARDPERLLVVETSPAYPRTHGLPPDHPHSIALDEIDVWIESDARPVELPDAEAGPVEQAIADHVARFVPSGATLQTGIGGIPNAVVALLAAGSGRDYGVHSEMFTDGLMRLQEAGKVRNRKGIYEGRSITTFAMGSRALYDWLEDREDVCFLPVDIVNDPAVIARNHDLVSINGALEIDLFGQVVADSIAGVQHSGIGGHEDFLAGAGLIADGRSLLCLPSTVTVRGETRSRVAPKLAAGSIVTSPRHQVDVVVTEHGIAELAGRTVGERAHLLAGIAHPDFRDELFEAARTIDRLGVR
ncbi:MAG: acetyl-CoA hydrolase/transferase family protein [Spirochaetaceae bacterium]|nr:acetyl-CoA hydrolase/transferase family protein [Myxococcales bacterium]MCB9725014.1 acetyl-CoA hydrolase/transferase family protein [Spirochaetaceae bacterium]